VGVSLINPGFVETPLTAQNGLQKCPPSSARQQAAELFCKAGHGGQFEIISQAVYLLDESAALPALHRLFRPDPAP